jgi:hypothetical protein
MKKAAKHVKINGKQITNDARALKTLNLAGTTDDDMASQAYRAYRPYFCPKFGRVWPLDGDWDNLTDTNLLSDQDDQGLPSGDIVPVTTQRRIWHDQYRIGVKLPIHDQIFFTKYDSTLFGILANRKTLSGWYIQQQIRKSKTVYRLYCRICGKTIISFSEIVALFDAERINLDDVAGSLLQGKRWLRDNHLQVDHLRDNPQNNCVHNLAIVPEKWNTAKKNLLTRITVPYALIVV